MKLNESYALLLAAAVGVFLISGAASVGAVSSIAPGQPGDLGVGAIFGAPTGLSMKYWLSQHTAIDAALALHFGNDEDRFQIHADHLWHIDLPGLKVPEGRLPLYVGLGLRVLTGEDSEAGIRFPLGMSFLLNRAPVELFAEIVPVLRFAPDTDGDIDGGVGLRFYFK